MSAPKWRYNHAGEDSDWLYLPAREAGAWQLAFNMQCRDALDIEIVPLGEDSAPDWERKHDACQQFSLEEIRELRDWLTVRIDEADRHYADAFDAETADPFHWSKLTTATRGFLLDTLHNTHGSELQGSYGGYFRGTSTPERAS